MGAMKRLLEEVAQEQGTWDISDPKVIVEAQRRLALPYKTIAKWNDGDRAGYEIELPDGTRLIFTAEMCDCRDKYAYLRADLTEDITPRRQDEVIAHAG